MVTDSASDPSKTDSGEVQAGAAPPAGVVAAPGAGAGAVVPIAQPDDVQPEVVLRQSADEQVARSDSPTDVTASAAASGYHLTATGLAGMVKDNQMGFVREYKGGDGLAAALNSNGKEGINTKSLDFEKQREQYGSNSVDPPIVTPYLVLIWEGLHDVTLIMLIAAAVVSLVLGLTGGGASASEVVATLTPSPSPVEEADEQEWIEGVAILATVIVVLNLQAGTDWSKARTFRKQLLELENAKSVHVVRDGKDIIMHPRELVVGDVLRIAVGDILAADGVLLHGTEVKMDESALTGESKLIVKEPCEALFADSTGDNSNSKSSPFLLSGTNVMSGSGKVLVVAVGEFSLQGRILAEVNKVQHDVKTMMEVPEDEDDDDDNAPGGKRKGKKTTKKKPNPAKRCCNTFQRQVKQFFTFGNIDTGGTLVDKLNHLAIDIGKLGVIVATIAFFVMVTRWSIEEFATGDDAREWTNPEDVNTLLEFFIIAVTILVVAIPEGLPLAVTLSLAISMRRMTYDNNQVKHMDSCETMGSATTICSDKTGTLTQNRMTVMRVYADGQVYKQDPVAHLDVGAVIQAATDNISPEFVHALRDALVLNSSSTSNVTLESDGTSWVYQGNATECGLLKLATQLGADVRARRADPLVADPKGVLDWGVHMYPFSSSRKRMSWVVPRHHDDDDDKKKKGGFRLYSKGAPSYIFDACSSVLKGDALTAVEFSATERHECDAHVTEFQNDAMRTIAVAFRDFDEVPEGGWEAFHIDDPSSSPSSSSSSDKKGENVNTDTADKVKMFSAERDLTLMCVVGIEDPLRPTVIHAIERCNSAGVDVRMCTGDALATAVAISRQCNILRTRDMQVDKNGRQVPKLNFAMTGAEFDERVHFLDTSKPKLKRRAYIHATQEVGEMLQHPFLVDENKNKIINQTEFDEIWPKLRVLARCQPEDKLTLVRGLRHSEVFRDRERCAILLAEHGIKIFPDYQVVAVTGDGTNDAPALKNADVGFAMGIVGTDIAKQACDILLLDDNFASIVKAVMWGRNVYDSISKFIQFQLTVNISAITIAVVGAFAFTSSPLSAVQMLWVNMIMDTLASATLATEPPSEVLLERPPYGKRRPIISRVMICNMLGQSFFQVVLLMAIVFDASWLPGDVDQYPAVSGSIGHTESSVHWTIVFNTFVQMTLFNQINSRKLQTVDRLRVSWSEWNVFVNITNNPIFLIVLVLEFGLQVLIVQLGGEPFRLKPLNVEQWFFCIGVGAFSLVWQWVINAVILQIDSRVWKGVPEGTAQALKSSGGGGGGGRAKTTPGVAAGEAADGTPPMEDMEVVRERALANWAKVRRVFTQHGGDGGGMASEVSAAMAREDSWIRRGYARPFSSYTATKGDQINLEREMSDTGRSLLGLAPSAAAAASAEDAVDAANKV